MGEKLVININEGKKSGSLIDDIKSLTNSDNSTKTNTFMLSSFINKEKKKKDKKKDKKKKKQLESNLMGDEVAEVENDEENDGMIDIDKLLSGDDDDEDGLGDSIIFQQKHNYDQLKKEDNPFKKEFAEELTLLYELLEEFNKFGKKLENSYNKYDNSKIRGASKSINDLAMAVLTSKSNKLNVMKEIANIKKSIADLKIKADKDSKAAQQQNSSADQIAANYLQRIMKGGRNNFINNIDSISEDDDDDTEEVSIDSIINNRVGGGKYTQQSIDIDMDDHMDEIQSILSSNGNPFRTKEGNKYIQYENQGVRIIIKKYLEDGSWEFAALNKDNQEIREYPVPKRADVGKVKFSDDDRSATDAYGRRYAVIPILSETD